MSNISILSKIATARNFIKAQKLRKDATNDYSNYNYFTPEFIGKLVTDASVEANILCLFNLKKDELGYFGELTIYDLENGESIISVMRTEKPIIKATNETQQMGGMNTYTKRYCLMSFFDIEDNTIDFDYTNNPSNTSNNQQVTSQKKEKEWLNKYIGKDSNIETEIWKQVCDAIKTKKRTVEQIKLTYKISKELETELLNIIKK